MINNLNISLDLIVLAGWMRILTSKFIKEFDNIINLHPALPGRFPGSNAIEEAYNSSRKGQINNTGVMVHRVIEEIDAGQVIDYIEVPILEEDTLDNLKNRVQKCEKPLLLNSIMKVLNYTLNAELASIPEIISGKVRDRWEIGNNLQEILKHHYGHITINILM